MMCLSSATSLRPQPARTRWRCAPARVRITAAATLLVDDSIVPDNSPPVLAVLHPAATTLRLATNNPVFVLRGTARDNRELSGVFLQSGAGPFTRVSGSSNWSRHRELGPRQQRFSTEGGGHGWQQLSGW